METDTDDRPRQLRGEHELSQAVAVLAAQARRSLLLLSRELQPTLYDDEPFLGELRRLATDSPRARVRILLEDSASALRRGQRLLELARRLTSCIEIRRLRPDQELTEAMLVADDHGYLRQPADGRAEAVFNPHDRGRARQLAAAFDELWQHAEPDPELRRLHI